VFSREKDRILLSVNRVACFMAGAGSDAILVAITKTPVAATFNAGRRAVISVDIIDLSDLTSTAPNCLLMHEVFDSATILAMFIKYSSQFFIFYLFSFHVFFPFFARAFRNNPHNEPYGFKFRQLRS